MTCIIGLVQDNEVWMGGDSAGVADLNIRSRKDTKVFKVNGKFLIGYTSSFRMGQLLRFGFSPPEQKSKTSDFEYMCTEFIDAVRKRMKEGGYMKVKDNEEEGGRFLVGHKGKLYCVDGDFQVGESLDGFDTVGCGYAYALGSLYETRMEKVPKKRILKALETAEYFSAGVRRPFVIKTLRTKKPPNMVRPVKKGK